MGLLKIVQRIALREKLLLRKIAWRTGMSRNTIMAQVLELVLVQDFIAHSTVKAYNEAFCIACPARYRATRPSGSMAIKRVREHRN